MNGLGRFFSEVLKLIKEFDYDVIEKIKPLGDDIWNIR